MRRHNTKNTRDSLELPGPVRALSWLRANESPSGGILSSRSADAQGDPGVTGALLPTLFRNGEEALAHRSVHWLLRIQHKDGSFPVRDPQLDPLGVTANALCGVLA